MAYTVGDLIFDAGIMAGLADPRDTALAPEDAAYGFRKLNQLVDLLATERLAIYREQRVGPFNLVASTQSYTIGDGATWDTARPLWIDRAGVIVDGGATDPVELPMRVLTTKGWSEIRIKSVTSTFPRSLFYDRQFNSSGYGLIYVYPVPSASTPDVVLYVPVAVTEFAEDSDDQPLYTTAISLPPGYRAMLVSNLAVIMSIGVLPVSEDLRYQAVDTLSKVKAANVVTHMDQLSCDAATRVQSGAGAPFDFLTGGIS